MEYINEFIKYKESKGEKAIYRVHDTRGYTYYSDDYVKWLEQQLRIHDVIKSVCDDCTAYPFDERGKTPLCKTCKDNPSQNVL